MLTTVNIDDNEVLKWLCKSANSIYHSSSLPIFSQLPLKTDTLIIHDDNDNIMAIADIYDSIGLVIIICKGSQTIHDWVSNFTQFPATGNHFSIPDFIHDNAVKISAKLLSEDSKIFKNKQIICCGHSRGGGIASYLGYHIASNFGSNETKVSVMTFCAVPYANEDFKSLFNNVVSKSKNFISVMDPLQALWLCRSIPGETRILEFTYPVDSIIALFTIPLTAFVEEIHSMFDKLFHLEGISEIGISFMAFKSSNLFTNFTNIVTMFLLGVGTRVFQGDCHKLGYTEHVIRGGIEPLIEEIFDLCVDVKKKSMNIVNLITKFVLGPLFGLLKKVFINIVESIENLWKALKDFVNRIVKLCLSPNFFYPILKED